jgi:AcrR family transcriptional regulator
MTRAAKYKPEHCCNKAEEVLSNGESLAAICAELDITRTTLYEWRDTHAEFKEAIERGLQKAQRFWEQLGVDGVKGNYDKFGSAPWIFTMKNRFREDYKEDKDVKAENTSLVEKLLDRLIID